MTMDRHIVGLGGGGDTAAQTALLHDYVLGLTGEDRPRLLWVPTASADNTEYTVWFYESFSRQAEVSTLMTFPWPPENLREVVLEQDAICVSGGNTANMLAIWRVHGIDTLMREAWEKGIVLWGASAGMICWFEMGVTDSFGPQLEGLRDGLGFLPGSACPHYDGEELRRPVYERLLREGFPPGIALDDAAGAHYVGTELHEVVASSAASRGYLVGPHGEQPLETRRI
jgi:dipeptidase E